MNEAAIFYDAEFSLFPALAIEPITAALLAFVGLIIQQSSVG